MSFHLDVVSGCFHTVVAELSSYRNLLVLKAKSTYCVSPLQKVFADPCYKKALRGIKNWKILCTVTYLKEERRQ